ncbi:MAG TPA: transglycosylase family protein [Cellulomonas sp.]|uniref:transglycosylase family protein n=1 Tax=Cellulomonas sp. TaxID=40001 RepID=UPI002E3618CA|nr:transglycosylase family protein [Cellulomonas sp.]HEX5333011.1 transglycosylase family protein [Cellulomonas sp.]
MTVLATGTAVYAQVNKTVTLDVDGVASTVTSYSGSVDGLLAQNGITLGERDTVAPAGALREGADIVVRHAHQVTVMTDGVQQTVWTTALTAAEALDTLSARGADVQLVASRSTERRSPFLALELTIDGPAHVQVDGTTLTAADGSTTVAQVLDQLGITLGDLDTVAVKPAPDGVLVVVSRVVVQDVTTTTEIPAATVTQDDPALVVGKKVVTTKGVAGVRTVVETVTTVDGVETARVPVSDQVTQAAVDEVVHVGTKPKPVVTAAPKVAAAAGTPVAAGGSADSLNWAALARCESGGNPTIVSSNGLYYGLYQFSVGTWQAVGGAGLPSQASADEQTSRAKMLYNRSGAGQWPVCGKNLFS